MPVPPTLRAVELKPFVPSKDFALSKRFYQDLGFTKASDANGTAFLACLHPLR